MPSIEKLLKALVVQNTGCWEWPGAKARGYGHARVPGFDTVMVHRIVWEYLQGPIPEGLQIDHLCRNKCCCNPEHLEVVNGRVNVLRGETFAAANAAKTHCPRGHPYEGENLYVAGDGSRNCRACRKASDQATRKGNAPGDRTHCPKGHPYEGENLGFRTKGKGSGDRYCKQCSRDDAKASYCRHREASATKNRAKASQHYYANRAEELAKRKAKRDARTPEQRAKDAEYQRNYQRKR